MTVKFRPYPKYKEVPIEWTKVLPMNWSIKPFRSCCTENANKNSNLSMSEVLSLSYGKVILKNLDKNFGLAPENYSSYQVMEPGDIVMRLTDLQNDHVSLRTGLVKNRGIITSAYLGLKVKKEEIDERFFHWLLHSYDLQKVFYGMGGGVRQTVGFNELKWLPIIVPEITNQKRISDFLDDKTKYIDEILRKKHRLIELLKEKHASDIVGIVSKGLSERGETTDSKIDWIGSVPTGWSVEKMKTVILYHSGGIWGDKEYAGSENNMICVRVADFYFNSLRVSEKSLTVRNIKKNYHSKILSKNNILLEKSGGGEKQPVGRAILFDLDCRSVCSNFIERVVLKDGNNAKYVTYVLAALYFGKINTRSIKQTTGIQNLDINNYLNEYIPIPPISTQNEIVDYLDKETHRVNESVIKIQSQIQKLKEYRASLIYNAVTGKIQI